MWLHVFRAKPKVQDSRGFVSHLFYLLSKMSCHKAQVFDGTITKTQGLFLASLANIMNSKAHCQTQTRTK